MDNHKCKNCGSELKEISFEEVKDDIRGMLKSMLECVEGLESTLLSDKSMFKIVQVCRDLLEKIFISNAIVIKDKDPNFLDNLYLCMMKDAKRVMETAVIMESNAGNQKPGDVSDNDDIELIVKMISSPDNKIPC